MTTWSEIILHNKDGDFVEKDKSVDFRTLNRSEFQNRLDDFRDKIKEDEDSSISEAVDWYTSINRAMLQELSEQIQETDKSGVWRYLVGFKNLLKSIECQGIASSYGIKYFGRGVLGGEAFVQYVRYDFLAKELINSTLNYVPSLKPICENIKVTMRDFALLETS